MLEIGLKFVGRYHEDYSNMQSHSEHPCSLSDSVPHRVPPRNLGKDALHLASVLTARVNDDYCYRGSIDRQRSLLSRALVRGELDQLLKAFFTDPIIRLANVKVERSRTHRAALVALSIF